MLLLAEQLELKEIEISQRDTGFKQAQYLRLENRPFTAKLYKNPNQFLGNSQELRFLAKSTCKLGKNHRSWIQ